MQNVFGMCEPGNFHSVNGLIQAVQSGVPFAARIFRQVQDEVQLSVADLQRAGPIAFERSAVRNSGSLMGRSGLLRFGKIIGDQKRCSAAENQYGDSSQAFRPFALYFDGEY